MQHHHVVAQEETSMSFTGNREVSLELENGLSVESNTFIESKSSKKAANRIKKITRLNKKIDEFVEKYANQPKQKSPEWYQWRITGGPKEVFLGGSEIATATGLNPYQSRAQLIRSKCEVKTGKENDDPIAMHWGSHFEDILARAIEIDLDTQIKGTEMTITDHSLYRYSTDGIGVIGFKFDTDGTLIDVVLKIQIVTY